jgi:hypothetical protein
MFLSKNSKQQQATVLLATDVPDVAEAAVMLFCTWS